MLLDVLPRTLIKHIGSDGTDELSPGVHRGHHLVELINIAIKHYGTYPFVIERFPQHIHEEVTVTFDEIDLKYYFQKYNGIILYDQHCAVYQYIEPDKVYSPIGRKIDLSSIVSHVLGFIGFP